MMELLCGERSWGGVPRGRDLLGRALHYLGGTCRGVASLGGTINGFELFLVGEAEAQFRVALDGGTALQEEAYNGFWSFSFFAVHV